MTPIKTYQVTYQFGGSAQELMGVLKDLETKANGVANVFKELPNKLTSSKNKKNSAVDSMVSAYAKLAEGQSKVLESQANLVTNWKKQLSEMEAATKVAIQSINATLSNISVPAGAFKGLEALANLKTGGAKAKGAQGLLPSLLGDYGSIKEFEEDLKKAESRFVSTRKKIQTLKSLQREAQAAGDKLVGFEKRHGNGNGKNWVERTTNDEEARELKKQHKSLMDAKIAANKALANANNAAGGNIEALRGKIRGYLADYRTFQAQNKKIAAAVVSDQKQKAAGGDPFNINVNVDTAAAKTALEKLATDFKSLSSQFVIKPTIQVDAAAITAKLKDIKAEVLVTPVVNQEGIAALQNALKEVKAPIATTKQSAKTKAAKEAVADAKLSLAEQKKQLQQYATDHPIKIKTVYETKGLATKLNDTIKKLQAKAKEKSITISANFSADGIVAALDAALAKAQELAQSKALTVKTNVLSENNAAAVKSSIGKLQKQTDSKPVAIKTKLTGGGEVGEALNLSIGKLQKLAEGKPLTIKTKLIGGGEAGEALSSSIGKLQRLANERAISLHTKLTGGGEMGEQLSLSLGKLQKLADTKPIIIKTKLDTALTSEQLNSLLATTAKAATNLKTGEKSSSSIVAPANIKPDIHASVQPVAAAPVAEAPKKKAKAQKAATNGLWAMSKSEENAYQRAEAKLADDRLNRLWAQQEVRKANQRYYEQAFGKGAYYGDVNPRTGKRVAWDEKSKSFTTEAAEEEDKWRKAKARAEKETRQERRTTSAIRQNNDWAYNMLNPMGKNQSRLLKMGMEERAQKELAKQERLETSTKAWQELQREKQTLERAVSIGKRYNDWATEMLSPMGKNQSALLKADMIARNDAFIARRQAAHQQWLERDASSESPRQKRISERKELARQSRLAIHNEQELNRVRQLRLSEEQRALSEAERANKMAKAGSKTNGLVGSAALRRQQLIASAQANNGKNGMAANIRRNTYPLTGNTSFGARTPVALDMAKGMGMMFAVSGVMSAVTDSFHQVAEYDNLMKTVRAILQTTDKGANFNGRFEAMENTVREVGRKTKFTAPEVAGAARFMAMAGLNIENINAATEPIANLALIGDTELSDTADKMTNIMTSFGLLKGLNAGQQKKNMIHTSDVLTNTFTRSNTDMLQLAEAMQYAGPMSHLFGTSLEDAAAMVGVMGNAGIQASMAGTSLRMMYQNIVKPNKNQTKEWERLGITRTDKNGNIRPIFEILKDLRAKLTGTKDLNARIDPETLKSLGTGVMSLFRTTAGSGVAALLENLGEAEAIANTNRSANGVAAKIADEKKNTIAGLWAQVTSTFTDQNLTVATDFQNTIKQILTDLRDWLSSTEAAETLRSIYDLVNSVLNVFKEVAKMWVGMYRVWPGFFKGLIAVQFALSQVGALMSPFVGLLSVAGSVKNTIMGVAGAFGALNTAAGVSTVGVNSVSSVAKAVGAKTAAVGASVLSANSIPSVVKAVGAKTAAATAAATTAAATTGSTLATAAFEKQMLAPTPMSTYIGRYEKVSKLKAGGMWVPILTPNSSEWHEKVGKFKAVQIPREYAMPFHNNFSRYNRSEADAIRSLGTDKAGHYKYITKYVKKQQQWEKAAKVSGASAERIAHATKQASMYNAAITSAAVMPNVREAAHKIWLERGANSKLHYNKMQIPREYTMPFHNYSRYNRTGADAIRSLGTNKGVHYKYIAEYIKKQQQWEKAAKASGASAKRIAHATVQASMYNAAITSAIAMKDARETAHKKWLERRANTKLYANLTDEQKAKAGAFYRNMRDRIDARHRYRVLSNATIVRATEMGKISTMKGTRLAFTNGVAAANALSFAPLVANIRTGLMSVVAAISRGLGMLVSPLGLAAAAITGLAWLWAHNYSKQKELFKKDEELAKRGEAGRTISKQAIMGNVGVVGTILPSQMLEAPKSKMVTRTRNGRTILGSYFDPMLKNSKEYRGAFNDSIYSTPEQYDAYMQRFADTAGALYGKRGMTMTGQQMMLSEMWYQKRRNKNGIAPSIGSLEGNRTLRRDALNRLTAFNLGSASSAFASRKKIVQGWINHYDQLPENKKTPEAQQELYRNIGAMASSLREEAAERPSVIGRNISNMRATQVAQSREAYEGMAQQIEAMKDYVNSFNTGLQQLAGMMTFQAQNIHGQIVKFNLPFSNGALDWNALTLQFKMLGVKFANNLNGHWSMMLQVFNTIQNNAELAKKYAGMSAGQLAALFDPINVGYKFNPQEWKGWVVDWFNDNSWSGKKEYKNGEDFFSRGGWRTDTSLNAIRNYAFDKMTGNSKIVGSSGSGSGANSTTAGGGAHGAADQSKYDSKYKNHRARPTQIIFNIDKLCNFSNTTINDTKNLSTAEGIGKQLSIGLQELFAQAVSEYAIIGESQG